MELEENSQDLPEDMVVNDEVDEDNDEDDGEFKPESDSNNEIPPELMKE